MITNTKSTPKSCSCSQCRRGKHGGAKDMVRADERAYRHNAKIKLNEFGEDAVLQSGPIGNYYD
jgi:hypothetical protein